MILHGLIKVHRKFLRNTRGHSWKGKVLTNIALARFMQMQKPNKFYFGRKSIIVNSARIIVMGIKKNITRKYNPALHN